MEYGSDFHTIEQFGGCRNERCAGEYRLFANGRQGLAMLLRVNGWSRIWLPEYYCGEVVDYIARSGVEVVRYLDYPQSCDDRLSELEFRRGDVLLRVNYFGMRRLRSNHLMPIPVIEDHTHDPFGEWAMGSDADWCVASLRKTMPVAEGGVVWSPNGLLLPDVECVGDERVARLRWQAMDLKRCYLSGADSSKQEYLDLFKATELQMSELSISALDARSRALIECFDIESWTAARRDNWRRLVGVLEPHMRCLMPEDERCNPLAVVLLFDSPKQRDEARTRLINNEIYPAVLWNVESGREPVVDFSRRMLSIHCDARYTSAEIDLLGEKIKMILND